MKWKNSLDEIKTLMHDSEALIKATANQTGDEISALRARAGESLREARSKLSDIECNLEDRTKAAVKVTNRLVHEHPWKSVAIATAVGVMLGLIIRRR